jgi:hypothetical protein
MQIPPGVQKCQDWPKTSDFAVEQVEHSEVVALDKEKLYSILYEWKRLSGVLWTKDPYMSTKGNYFYKIISPEKFQQGNHPNDLARCLGEDLPPHWSNCAVYFLHIFQVYRKYQELWNEAKDTFLPSPLVKARLLHGRLVAVVEMPFVGNRCATDTDYENKEMCKELADALWFLASQKGLLYTDLRAQNIRIDDANRKPYIVDYDDMIILKEDDMICCVNYLIKSLQQANDILYKSKHLEEFRNALKTNNSACTKCVIHSMNEMKV